MICTVCTLGMVAIAPKVGRLSRQSCFTRFESFGVSGITRPWNRRDSSMRADGRIKPFAITSRVIDPMTWRSHNGPNSKLEGSHHVTGHLD